MLISWISKECISYQIPRILSSGWLIMCHAPQRCLCCRCSSYIAITDGVNPLLLGSLESWYWWMGEAPEWRRWDDQCKLPPAATNWWIWEGMIMFWLGQWLRLLGLIIGERWIEETDMVLESFKHACMILYHVWCEIASVFSVYICCALLGTASKNYSYTGRLHSMRCLSIIVVLISHLPISCHGDKKKTSSSCKLCLPKVFIGVVPSRRARDGTRSLQVVHLWFPMGLLMNLESIVNPKIIE